MLPHKPVLNEAGSVLRILNFIIKTIEKKGIPKDNTNILDSIEQVIGHYRKPNCIRFTFLFFFLSDTLPVAF